MTIEVTAYQLASAGFALIAALVIAFYASHLAMRALVETIVDQIDRQRREMEKRQHG